MAEMTPNSKQLLPQALATGGMVASAHPQAARIGVDTLRRGGSTVDAALATAFAEWVLLPGMCGPGGDMFALVRDGATGRVRALLGAGAAPAGFTPEFFHERGYTRIPQDGVLAANVPGAVAGCWDLHQAFGRLPWAELLQPAIGLAREGFPCTERVAFNLSRAVEVLQQFGDGAPYLRAGVPVGAGERLVQADMAATLETLAATGPQEFYRGRIAEAIVGHCQALGAPVSLDDYAAHRSEWADPLQVQYRGWDVLGPPPPSQALILLEELKLVEGWDLAHWQPGSAEVIHLQVEAKKLTFQDRLRWCGDPRFVHVPLERLLSDVYAAERRRLIDLERAAPNGPETDGGTTYLAVADAQGNAVSFIHSLMRPMFGCGVIVPGTGVALNNRIGGGFTLEAGQPNQIAGGKRTMSTLTAFMVVRDGQLRLVVGTPGGDQQVQWNFQALVNWIDFGMNPQQVVEAPRWQSTPGTDPGTARDPFELWVEDRAPGAVLAELERRGHRLRSLGPWARQGAMQLIELDPAHGVLKGGTDPRAGGLALGYY